MPQFACMSVKKNKKISGWLFLGTLSDTWSGGEFSCSPFIWKSDISSAGTVEASRNVSSVFIWMPALPPFITHSNPNDSVCLHVRTDGRWNDNSSYFHLGCRFSLLFFFIHEDGRNVAPNLLNRHWWGNSLCSRSFFFLFSSTRGWFHRD